MRTRGRLCILVLALAAAGACSDSVKSPTMPYSPNSHSPEFSKSAGDQQLVHVTGSAFFMYIDAATNIGYPEQYENEAHRDASGLVKGEFNFHRGAANFHGDVVCFNVSGKDVRMAGRVESSDSWQIPPGSYIYWSWRDNGEGRNDPPDQTTMFFVTPNAVVAQYHCDNGIGPLPFYPVTRGNLSIHTEEH